MKLSDALINNISISVENSIEHQLMYKPHPTKDCYIECEDIRDYMLVNISKHISKAEALINITAYVKKGYKLKIL